MAEFLTTHSTTSAVEQIIIEAKDTLFLISPFLQISKIFYERLKDASNRNVSIKMVCKKYNLKTPEELLLPQLKNLSLYSCPNLHAKCYFNETKMVITSMNLYEFSEKNNREMGVLICRSNDTSLFTKAAFEALSIIQSSILINTNKTNLNPRFDNLGPAIKKNLNIPGYCIRCETKIDFNPSKPLCAKCYSIWAEFENANYPEKVCHRCGKPDRISYEIPQCHACFEKYTQHSIY